jgi:methylmalonyl-CoA/ethylmalonyl-CoA epimerase
VKPGRVDHVGIVVRDLDFAESFLRAVFGLERAGIEPSPGVRAVFYQAGDITIQLVEDERRLGEAPIARLEHICMDVDDIDEVMAASARFGAGFAWEEPVVHGGGRMRAQFITENGGLGVVFQLNDSRGTPDGRQYAPADLRAVSEATRE